MNLTSREWTVFGLVVVGVLFGGLLLISLIGSVQGIGMGGMGPGMMGGVNTVGWLLPCLIPAGLLIILIGGLGWLLATVFGAGQSSDSSSKTDCPNCGRTVQADWQFCPYCGTSLRKEQARE
jgi:hypothetical protein